MDLEENIILMSTLLGLNDTFCYLFLLPFYKDAVKAQGLQALPESLWEETCPLLSHLLLLDYFALNRSFCLLIAVLPCSPSSSQG